MVTLPAQTRSSSSAAAAISGTGCKEKRMITPANFLHKLATAYKRSPGSRNPCISHVHPVFLSAQQELEKLDDYRRLDQAELAPQEEEEDDEQSRRRLGHPPPPHIFNPSLGSSDSFIISTIAPPPDTTKFNKSYSLSSGALSTSCNQSQYSSSSITVSSKISSCSRNAMAAATSRVPSASLIAKFTSLWDEDAEETSELPPIHPSDLTKTLLYQLAASISDMKSAYARQQAALKPYNMQACARGGGNSGGVNISATDKVIKEEMQRLSQLHLQLADVLQHIMRPDAAEEDDGLDEHMGLIKKDCMLMLRKYEGIIALIHDEMRRKEAVALALKETLAKSLLKGEKLERRVKALEAKLCTLSMH